jgi:arsenical pump membrane protein
MQAALTLTIVAATLLLVFIRPKGLSEAWFTVLGGAAMLAFGLVTPRQAIGMVVEGKDALLFLVGLLLLADLMRVSGCFDWAAVHAARSATGNGHALFRNIFILGAVVTALLSLDTTAVMLTPVVMALVGRLKLQARPFLFVCAFIANTGSLLLQVSNLTNLLFAGVFGWGFAAFSARMVLPQVLALLANYFIFRWMFRKSLPALFPNDSLPEPSDVVPDRRFFRASMGVFAAVLLGYFVGALIHVPPYVFGLTGAVVLLIIGLRLGNVKLSIVQDITWSVFPFVIGLFVVVRAMENLGLATFVSQCLNAGASSPTLTVFLGVFGAGIGSNVVNNIPMALLSMSSLAHGSELARYSALVGCDLGPNLTVAGSLATMLVITSARKHGEDMSPKDFFLVGIKVTPAILVAGGLGLLATTLILR